MRTHLKNWKINCSQSLITTSLLHHLVLLVCLHVNTKIIKLIEKLYNRTKSDNNSVRLVTTPYLTWPYVVRCHSKSEPRDYHLPLPSMLWAIGHVPSTVLLLQACHKKHTRSDRTLSISFAVQMVRDWFVAKIFLYVQLTTKTRTGQLVYPSKESQELHN